jgi:hypothetical protein
LSTRNELSNLNSLRLIGNQPTASGTPSVIDDLASLAKEVRRTGNFLNSILSVFRHVASEEAPLADQVDRAWVTLSDLETYQEGQLANIRALKRFVLPLQEKLVGESDPSQPWWPAQLSTPAGADNDGEQDGAALNYWRGVRNDLTTWFALSLEDLSRVLALSYATFANLGRRKPQGRTIRSVMALHGLAKACIDADGEKAVSWLQTKGHDLLLGKGLQAFESDVNQQLFARTEVPRTAIRITSDGEVDIEWQPAAPEP